MPNWCYTTINIKRPTEKGGTTDLYSLLNKWTNEESDQESDWGNKWLGYIINKAFDVEPQKTEYRHRGSIDNVSINDAGDRLTISTVTAWRPMLGMWYDIVKKYCSNADLTYIADEPMMKIFVSNDPEFRDKYYVDTDNASEYAADISRVKKIIKEITGRDVSNVGDIEKAAMEDKDFRHLLANNNINICKWEFCETLPD